MTPLASRLQLVGENVKKNISHSRGEGHAAALVVLNAQMHGWGLGRAEWRDCKSVLFCVELREGKKEEFPGFMKSCGLGTPFPRSALFLVTSV